MSKSIEELLALVKSRPAATKKDRPENTNVLDFIEDLGIESGTQKVPNFVIFYVYRKIWGQEFASRKVKKITFFQTFGKHFPDYRVGSQRFYLLKEGLFDVTDDLKIAAEQYDKQYWSSSKKKV